MKVPALWIAAAFSTGILLRPEGSSPAAPLLVAAGALILAGAMAAKFLRPLWPSGIVALAAWCALGAASVSIEHNAVLHDNVCATRRVGKDRHEPAFALARPLA